MKPYYTLFFLSLLLTFYSNNYAQTMIKGKVIDAQSRQPLENALVTDSKDAAISTLTDEYGNFILKTKDDTVYLAASTIGYASVNFFAKKNESNKVELKKDITRLKAITLQSNRLNSVSKIDLRLNPIRSSQELLRIVPGLFIAQHAGGGKAEQIFLRGFDCDHGTDVQISVDGIPVNMVSHAHGQGYADAHFIIPETINNIDFGAGPYYTNHGNLNTAGYVSFSTYTNIDKSKIQIEAGNFGTFRTLAMIDLVKKNKDKESAYIAGDFNYTNGPTVYKQHFNRLNIFGKYHLALNKNTLATFSASAFKSKWNASGQLPERAVESGIVDRFGSLDPSEGGNTERYNGNFIISHNFKNGANWETQLYFSRYIFNLYSNFTFYLNDPINGDEINQAEKRNIFGLQSTFKQKYHIAQWTLQGAYGIGIRKDGTKNSLLSNVNKRNFLNYSKLGDIDESNLYAYTQYKVVNKQWLFDMGIRFDQFYFNYLDKLGTSKGSAESENIISPKLNIQYTASPKIQFFAKAGKGFHSNDTRVIISNQGKNILPAAYGTDLGVTLKPHKNLFLSIVAWSLFLEQEFVYVGDEGVVEPSGKTKRKGIETILRYQFAKHLFANFNINFTQPKSTGVPKAESYIPLAPTLTSTGGIFYKEKKGMNGSLTYRYIKDRSANEDNSIVAKGYFIMDGALNYTQDKYEIGIAVENIFNIKWNEAQFATESKLADEASPITELHFTPGIPFFVKAKLAIFF